MVGKKFICTVFLCLACTAVADEPPCDESKNRLPISLYDAIALTLDNQAEIEISRMELVFQQGVARERGEPFDPTLGMGMRYDHTNQFQYSPLGIKSNEHQYETRADVEFFTKTRLGTRFEANMNVDKIQNKLLAEPFVLQEISDVVNTGILTFQVTQPLLRDFAYGEDMVQEKAAQFEVLAVFYDNLQVISLKLFNTTTSYWELIAAEQALKVQLDAERRFEKLVADTERLIKEDQMAPNDLNQPLLQLATQRIERNIAQQRVFAAKEALKFNMGITNPCEKCVDDLIVNPEFPEVAEDIACLCKRIENWSDQALTWRYDLLAARTRVTVNEWLVKGADNETLPQLDVFGGVTETNFTLGGSATPLFSSLKGSAPQTDVYVGFRFSTPFWNDGPQGRLRERQARRFQAMYNEQLLAQQILRDLRAATSDTLQLLRELDEANKAVKTATTMVRNENIKLQAGESTIFFVVDFETKLTQAQLQRLEIVKSYFQNIAAVRFLTATLMQNLEYDCAEKIQVQDLVRLPGLEDLDSDC